MHIKSSCKDSVQATVSKHGTTDPISDVFQLEIHVANEEERQSQNFEVFWLNPFNSARNKTAQLAFVCGVNPNSPSRLLSYTAIVAWLVNGENLYIPENLYPVYSASSKPPGRRQVDDGSYLPASNFKTMSTSSPHGHSVLQQR